MNNATLAEALEHIAPATLAEDWDNVGMLVGDPDAELGRGPIVLTIDLTRDVLDEAISAGARAMVAYHPPIFSPMRSIVASDPKQALVLGAIAHGMSVFSPHTALDAVEGGVADWLLDQAVGEAESALSATKRTALAAHLSQDNNRTHKLVVFVPTEPDELLGRVRDALAVVGAGTIGNYSRCAFSLEGMGFFEGGAGANPTIGRAGALETVREHRLEMVCPGDRLAEILTVLRDVHPYEEPAFDVYRVEKTPDGLRGAGRVQSLGEPGDVRAIAKRLQRALGVEVVKLAGPECPSHGGTATCVAVCPGSGGSLLEAAIARGADLFITGELSHHETLFALSRGCSVLLAGHTNTERGYLPVLRNRLMAELPDLDVRISARDGYPFAFVR